MQSSVHRLNCCEPFTAVQLSIRSETNFSTDSELHQVRQIDKFSLLLTRNSSRRLACLARADGHRDDGRRNAAQRSATTKRSSSTLRNRVVSASPLPIPYSYLLQAVLCDRTKFYGSYLSVQILICPEILTDKLTKSTRRGLVDFGTKLCTKLTLLTNADRTYTQSIHSCFY